jgi:uncharacterized protein YciI
VRYFAVTEESGPAWDHSRPMNEQAGWTDHAAFMNRLDDEGFIVLGGPLLGDRHTALLIVDAHSEEAVHARLAPDPWIAKGLLRITKIAPWQIVLGGQRAD